MSAAAAAYHNVEPQRKKPKYVIRPAPSTPPKYLALATGGRHRLDRHGWMIIFSYLPRDDLTRCLRVCRTWYRWAMNADFYPIMELKETALKHHHMRGIIRRQPKTLDLTGSNVSHEQLGWLTARLPHLKHLILVRNSWAAVSSLCSSSCPLLYSIDLSWVSSVRSKCLRDLLAPPTDHRPGVIDTVSRFRRCTRMDLTGSNIDDSAIEYLSSVWLPKLTHLSLAFVVRITEKGLESLAKCESLKELKLQYCHGIRSLSPLRNVPALQHVQLGSQQVTMAKEFIQNNSSIFEFVEPNFIRRKSDIITII